MLNKCNRIFLSMVLVCSVIFSSIFVSSEAAEPVNVSNTNQPTSLQAYTNISVSPTIQTAVFGNLDIIASSVQAVINQKHIFSADVDITHVDEGNSLEVKDVLVGIFLYNRSGTQMKSTYITKKVYLGCTEGFSGGFDLPSDVTDLIAQIVVWDGNDTQTSPRLPQPIEIPIAAAPVYTPTPIEHTPSPPVYTVPPSYTPTPYGEPNPTPTRVPINTPTSTPTIAQITPPPVTATPSCPPTILPCTPTRPSTSTPTSTPMPTVPPTIAPTPTHPSVTPTSPAYDYGFYEVKIFTDVASESYMPNQMLETIIQVSDISSKPFRMQDVFSVMALYNREGKMVDITYTRQKIAFRQQTLWKTGIKLPEYFEGYKLHVYVWDNLERMRLLSAVSVVPVKYTQPTIPPEPPTMTPTFKPTGTPTGILSHTPTPTSTPAGFPQPVVSSNTLTSTYTPYAAGTPTPTLGESPSPTAKPTTQPTLVYAPTPTGTPFITRILVTEPPLDIPAQLPNEKITRAEFVKLLVTSLGYKPSDKSKTTFKDDAKIPAWAKGYIATAVGKGIVKGFGDNTFRPSSLITRAEITVMVIKSFGYKEGDKNLLKFKDKDKIPNWAKGYVTRACALGVVRGYTDNEFKPLRNTSRAEAFIVIEKTAATKKKKG